MKLLKHLFAFLISLSSLSAMAQIPNANFESILTNGQLSNWGAVYLFPVSIDTNGSSFTDSIVFDNYFYAPSNLANSGNHALELRNAFDYTTGWAIVGEASVDTDSIYSAWGNLEIIPTQDRPVAIYLSYQYFPVLIEMGSITYTLYDSSGNTIGQAYAELDSTSGSYEQITIPVTYLSNDPVAFYSLNIRNDAFGCFMPGFGTRLLVDDIGLVLNATTGIDEKNTNNLTLYPNPSTDQLFLLTASANYERMELFDLKGNLLSSTEFSPSMDISRLQPGMYALRVTGNGTTINKKFIKQ